jgi:NAD(P)-dependent dehydrogenase (short-subunit alcohol dehydrogenase family)
LVISPESTEAANAVKIAEVAMSRFESIDALVNNAAIYFSKPFTDYTFDDLRALISINIEGFLFIILRAAPPSERGCCSPGGHACGQVLQDRYSVYSVAFNTVHDPVGLFEDLQFDVFES